MSNDDRIVKIGGQTIALGGFALLMMLAAILTPAVTYSVYLENPTPADLLVAIGVAMFASTLSLWVLDITGTITFTNNWASKSIYGAVIVSIMGTSVGVYKDAFFHDPNPFAGEWLVTVTGSDGNTIVARRSVNLSYSANTELYWGYGAPPPISETTRPWISVTEFAPIEGRIQLALTSGNADGSVQIIDAVLSKQGSANSYSSLASDREYGVAIARRN